MREESVQAQRIRGQRDFSSRMHLVAQNCIRFVTAEINFLTWIFGKRYVRRG